MLVSYTAGHKSGRRYAVPVQYARDGDRVFLYPGLRERKTWWRNLVDGAPVTVRISGRDVRGRAVAIRDDREAIAEGLRAFLCRFPKAGCSLGIARNAAGELDPGALAGHAEHVVIVRIDLEPERQSTSAA